MRSVSYNTKVPAFDEKMLDISEIGVIIRDTKVSYDTGMTGGDTSVATSKAIQKILEDLRSAIDQKKIFVYPRSSYKNTITQLGLTHPDVLDELYTLEERHYHKGPMLDDKFPKSDHLWVFKKRIEGEMIYIKFLVAYQQDGSVQVLSFHLDR